MQLDIALGCAALVPSCRSLNGLLERLIRGQDQGCLTPARCQGHLQAWDGAYVHPLER